MSRDWKRLLQAYMMLMNRTVELLPDDEIIKLEKDRRWLFYFRVAMQYKRRLMGETEPPPS